MRHSLVRTPLVVLAILSVAVLILYAQSGARGTWTAEVRADNPGVIHLQMQKAMKHSNMGNDFRVNDFRGLDASALKGKNQAVRFDLARDAGTITFTGTFNEGLGHGEFAFSANQ